MIVKILKYKEKYSDLIVIPKSTKVSNEKTISYDKKRLIIYWHANST